MALVEVTHLVKRFLRGRGLFMRGAAVTAVNDVTFAIEAGDTFGLVGESGSGISLQRRGLNILRPEISPSLGLDEEF